MNINVFSDQIKDAAVLKKKILTPNFNVQYIKIHLICMWYKSSYYFFLCSYNQLCLFSKCKKLKKKDRF